MYYFTYTFTCFSCSCIYFISVKAYNHQVSIILVTKSNLESIPCFHQPVLSLPTTPVCWECGTLNMSTEKERSSQGWLFCSGIGDYHYDPTLHIHKKKNLAKVHFYLSSTEPRSMCGDRVGKGWGATPSPALTFQKNNHYPLPSTSTASLRELDG